MCDVGIFEPSTIVMEEPRASDVARALTLPNVSNIVILVRRPIKSLFASLYNYYIIHRETPPALGAFNLPSFRIEFSFPVVGRLIGGYIYGLRAFNKNIYIVPLVQDPCDFVVEYLRLLSAIAHAGQDRSLAEKAKVIVDMLSAVYSDMIIIPNIRAICGTIDSREGRGIVVAEFNTSSIDISIAGEYPIRGYCDRDACYSIKLPPHEAIMAIEMKLSYRIIQGESKAKPIGPPTATKVEITIGGERLTCHENISSRGEVCTGEYELPAIELTTEEVCGQIMLIARSILDVLAFPNQASAYNNCIVPILQRYRDRIIDSWEGGERRQGAVQTVEWR